MSNVPTPLDNLINAFAYPLSKPAVARSLALQFRMDDLSVCGLDQNLLWAGALLAVGRVDEYKAVIEQADFSQLSHDDRVTFTDTLFRSFQDFLFGSRASSDSVDAMLCITRSLLPGLMSPERVDVKGNVSAAAGKKLIRLPYASRIASRVKGVVFFRALFMGPGSRKHEFGLRIQKCLASQGWDVSLLSPDSLQSWPSSAGSDFALLDIALLNAQHLSGESVTETLQQLRKGFRKIVVIEPDPWSEEHNGLLEQIIEHVDHVWGFTADWAILKNPAFSGKAILFPNVGGFDDMVAERDALNDWENCSFGFVGSIGIPNLPRIYWALESLNRQLPIHYTVTDPGRDDGKDREASLYSYAALLAASHVGVNYVTRLDGSRILTGRTLEIISLKRLLLQEYCPAMTPYFVEGEHYLEFSDIESLCCAVEFIKSHLNTARMIAREGYDFYMQHYSARKLVEHFQVLLDS